MKRRFGYITIFAILLLSFLFVSHCQELRHAFSVSRNACQKISSIYHMAQNENGGYLVSLFLGFSFGNLWICALLVFSLQTTNRLTCGGYLAGRTLAIVILSVMAALIGRVVRIDHTILNIISGLFLLGFSVYLAVTHILGWIPPWKKNRIHAGAEYHSDCMGHCSSCPTHDQPEYSNACSTCGEDPRLCAAEEPELEPLTRAARQQRGRLVTEKQLGGFITGIALGSIRGAALCSKLTILLPVLMGASIARAVGMGLTFSLSSSIYPLLGFFLGSFALKLVKYKHLLFGVSCLLLFVFSIVYIGRGLQ